MIPCTAPTSVQSSGPAIKASGLPSANDRASRVNEPDVTRIARVAFSLIITPYNSRIRLPGWMCGSPLALLTRHGIGQIDDGGRFTVVLGMDELTGLRAIYWIASTRWFEIPLLRKRIRADTLSDRGHRTDVLNLLAKRCDGS